MTWLINIVRNKAIDTLRSGKTERALDRGARRRGDGSADDARAGSRSSCSTTA